MLLNGPDLVPYMYSIMPNYATGISNSNRLQLVDCACTHGISNKYNEIKGEPRELINYFSPLHAGC